MRRKMLHFDQDKNQPGSHNGPGVLYYSRSPGLKLLTLYVVTDLVNICELQA